MLVSGGRVHGLLQKVMVAGRAHSGGLSPEREKGAEAAQPRSQLWEMAWEMAYHGG